VEFNRATKEAETMSIFETIFLERKVLLTLLNFRKVLEVIEEVACLAITLILKRLGVANKERDLLNNSKDSNSNDISNKLNDSMSMK
jgi:hypothetical protein